jgi:hypothetical protein
VPTRISQTTTTTDSNQPGLTPLFVTPSCNAALGTSTATFNTVPPSAAAAAAAAARQQRTFPPPPPLLLLLLHDLVGSSCKYTQLLLLLQLLLHDMMSSSYTYIPRCYQLLSCTAASASAAAAAAAAATSRAF